MKPKWNYVTLEETLLPIKKMVNNEIVCFTH